MMKYSSQCKIIQQIDNFFKNEKMSSKNEDQKVVFELIEQMQSFGSPPEELLNNLGLHSGAAEGNPEGQCHQM